MPLCPRHCAGTCAGIKGRKGLQQVGDSDETQEELWKERLAWLVGPVPVWSTCKGPPTDVSLPRLHSL